MEGLAPDRGLAGLVAGDVTGAVLREAEGVSVSVTQTFVSGLRSFLCFLFYRGVGGLGSLAGGAVCEGAVEFAVVEGDQSGGRSRSARFL